MISQMRFSPDFKVKLQESYDWYEKREAGLGNQFLRSVDVCLKTLQRPLALCQPGQPLTPLRHIS